MDAPDEASLQIALVQRLRETVQERGIRPGDCAVLAGNRVDSYRWAGVLRAAGFATQDLEDYVGTTSDNVKVGTVKRADSSSPTSFCPACATGRRLAATVRTSWPGRSARRVGCASSSWP